MKTEIQCMCGYGTSVDPASLKSSARCERCGKTLEFAATSDDRSNCYWIMIGPREGTPTRAIPLLEDRPLAIGNSEVCWLVISGEGVQAMNTEIRVDSDRRVHVRHLADAGRTWIDRAAILEGVLEFDNELRIADNVIRLCTTATLLRIAAADSAPVLFEDDDDSGGGGREYYDEEDRAPRRRRSGMFDDWSAGEKLRALALVAVIAVAVALTAKFTLSPSQSAEMPTQTFYTCSVDGHTFSGTWDDGIPKCPICGQRVIGAINYDAPPRGTKRPKPADSTVNDVAGAATTISGSMDKETP
ncbi:MAG TPA: hypothetical protein P5081_01455 [Phycisphaerae bacterium]|nr:hypothetical protein [Phycisphaerae bacterium]HRW51521.1 hypothetical protein [Phycisphaerae bacterium]